MSTMTATPAIERYAAPATIEEAVQLLSEGRATLLAGGTDLMPQTRGGVRDFQPLLLNLKRIPGLRGVSLEAGAIRVGALTTVTDLLEDPLLAAHARILPLVADRFASGQIRNSATIGGNICNASPAGDLIIPLYLLDAEVELVTWKDGALTTRLLPIIEFLTGPGQTRLESVEILTAIRFAVPATDFAGGFEKFGTRPALDISVVSVGIAGRRENGCLYDVRVALGAVAPTPLRGRLTEAAIEGQAIDDVTVERAAIAAADEIAPISDVRASAWYRIELTRTLVARLLRHVAHASD
jgi:CO/xanthine dehydrogenase FAD-binding subunit